MIRRIDDNIAHYAPIIWNAEELAPGWYIAGSHVWTPDFEAFESFLHNCGEIYGLFDSDGLAAVLYLEFTAPDAVNIHISVLRKIDRDELINFLVEMKERKAREGVKFMQGWVLEKNRGMMAIAEAVGFRRTGARMDFGEYNGRVLRWNQVRAS